MARLCLRAFEAGIEDDYVRRLVTTHRLIPEPPPVEMEHWPWALRIRTLGTFVVERDGQPVGFARKVQHRPLALLKALVALGGREVSESALTDALWPEAEGDAGHQVFATTLHRLRALLRHEDALGLREARLSLDARSTWVDVWAFERLLDHADHADDGGRLEEAARLRARALRMYRGRFLAEETTADWAVSARERLHARFLRHAARLCRRWADAGLLERAIEGYERGRAAALRRA